MIFASACAHTPAPTSSDRSTSQDGEVLQQLREGNIRFTSHQRIHPNQQPLRRQELTKGQAPGAIVVSCSDSRVPPEFVFDQGLGDIFSIRTAGHAVDAFALASVEYAIEHLDAKVIVVMGHTSCGAIKATMASVPGESTGSRNIDLLVASIRPGLKHLDRKDKTLRADAIDNVEATRVALERGSPFIHAAVEKGKVRIVAALYDLDSGDVELWE